MAAIWMRYRAELRGRWRALLVVALLVGLVGGAVLASLAGARRTDTAFGRLLEKTVAADILVNPDLGAESALQVDDVAVLANVVQASRVDGLLIGPRNIRSLDDFATIGPVLVSDGGAGYDFARLRIREGRMPRRDRPNEIIVNELFAERFGLSAGHRFPMVGLSFADLEALEGGTIAPDEVITKIRDGEFGIPINTRVVGIGISPDEVVVDQGFENLQAFFGPAFLERHPDVGVPYWGMQVRLRNGATDVPALREAVAQLVPDEAIAFQSTAATTTKVERAVRPSVGALTVFAIVIALTGLLVIGQALARQTFLEATDNDVLRALGTTRMQLFSAAMLRALLVSGAGTLLAFFVAILASPLTPIGVARAAEPDPGIAVDGAVLGLGMLITFVLVLLLAAVPAWRSAGMHARDGVSLRPSRVATAVTEVGLSVPASAGVRMALEPGRGRTAVPVRTTIVSAGLAIATVVAALVFASSLDHLVSTPRLFGWNWDTQMSVNAQQAQPVPGLNARDQVVDLLESAPAVARWGTVSLSDVELDGRPMPAVGIDPRRGTAALPTLVDGALPTRNNQIALGRLTMKKLGVALGATVTARSPEGTTHRLEVVGTVVLPGLGTYPGADKTSLGEGAVVTRDALYELGPDFGRDDFVVVFAKSSTNAQRNQVIGSAEEITAAVDPEGFDSIGVQRPSDIVAYDRVRSTPLYLALILAILASATVAHALVSAVRRRRRDLAMLATLGLTRRQVSSTVAWQATTVGVLALVIGLPLGVIGGRWTWGLLANDLGTLSEPKVPILAVLLVIPVVLLLCNIVAYVPGRIAARTRPAVVLRSE